MYLSQMGSIPLLTREEEIRLAKKIETTRMIFRRRCLESDYVVTQASRPAPGPRGELPFDRTMRISTAEANAKDKIAKRIPATSATIERSCDEPPATGTRSSRAEGSERSATASAITSPHRAIRRRRMAALTEELCLRTGRIIPLMRKLRSIAKKMDELASTSSARAKQAGSLRRRRPRS
jgi:RNA polymerase primary sigma factor